LIKNRKYNQSNGNFQICKCNYVSIQKECSLMAKSKSTYERVDLMDPGEVVCLLGVLPEEGVEPPPGGRVVLVAVTQVPLP
jgi:hypothetical protein